MKRILCVLLIYLNASAVFSQVTSNGTSIQINQSFVTNGPVTVSPYTKSNKNGTNHFDIHFTFKKGTRFTVIEPYLVGTSTSGYVVTVWNYNDKSFTKLAFYKKYLAAKKVVDSLNVVRQGEYQKAKLAYDVATAKYKSDSTAVEEKTDQKDANDSILNTKATQLVKKTLSINPTKDLVITLPKNKKPQMTPEVSNFIKAQAEFKQYPSTKQAVPINAADSLSKAIAALKKSPPDLSKAKKEYEIAKTELSESQKTLDAAKKALKTSEDNLQHKTATFLEAQTFQTQGLTSAPQVNATFSDTIAYKISKKQIGQLPDTLATPLNYLSDYDDLAFVDSWANGWQFFINSKDFSEQCTMIHPNSRTFTYGFLTLPIKLRFDNNKDGRFNFEQNLNFGVTFGMKSQRVSTSDVSWNYLAGVSVVSAPLNNATASTAATTALAFSPSLGTMFQYNKFQVGAFLGWDFVGGASAASFAYQGKPWIGLAIGVSLFTENQTTAPGSQSQN